MKELSEQFNGLKAWNKMKKYDKWGGRIVVAVCFIWLSFYAFDLNYVLSEAKGIFTNFSLITIMTFAYFLAFIFRARAWQLYLGKTIRMKPFLDGILYSLVINHLLPVKAGDFVRAGYLAQWEKVGWKTAFQSVVVMRLIDLIILGGISLVGALFLGLSLSFLFFGSVLAICIVVGSLIFLKRTWREILVTQFKAVYSILFSIRGSTIFFFVFLSWCLEATVLLVVVSQFEVSISYLQSLWVNSFTIAGQVFHFSPGGIGTYESFMSFALAAYKVPLKDAYTIAIITHGFKFLFSFVVGVYLILSVPISWKTLKLWLNRKED
jgi:uncharacterized membrane protein YbhN (UPF0104 family)